MTPKRKKLLKFIQEYIAKNDMSPSYEEMLKHLGYSPKSKSMMLKMLLGLQDEGYITRVIGRHRSIKINERE
jgi:SOS-response transcriptional repressor LexA